MNGYVSAETHAGVSNASNRFLQAIDGFDLDAYLDSFVDDGVWAIKERPEYAGREGLTSFWEKRSPKAAHRKHVLGGLYVVEDHGDEATVEVVTIIVDLLDGSTVAAGNSVDVLRRCEDGVWRYVRKDTGMQFKNL